MILCPLCGKETGVRETRSYGNYVRRRRHCDSPMCDGRVTTVEMPVATRGRPIDREGAALVLRRDVDDLLRISLALAEQTDGGK